MLRCGPAGDRHHNLPDGLHLRLSWSAAYQLCSGRLGVLGRILLVSPGFELSRLQDNLLEAAVWHVTKLVHMPLHVLASSFRLFQPLA
jgi:hypothetical protein